MAKTVDEKEAKEKFLRTFAWGLEALHAGDASMLLQRLGMTVKAARNTLLAWAMDGTIIIQKDRWGGEMYDLAPELRCKLFWQLKDEEKPDLYGYGHYLYEKFWQKKLDPLRDDLMKWTKTGKSSLNWRVVETDWNESVWKLLEAMFVSKEWRGYCLQLPTEIQLNLIGSIMDTWMEKMHPWDESFINEAELNATPEVKGRIETLCAFYRYVLSDRLDEMASKLPMATILDSFNYMVYDLWKGNAVEAVKKYQRGATELKKIDRYPNVFYMTLYVVALMRVGDSASRKKMATLVKKKDLYDESYAPVKLLVYIILNMEAEMSILECWVRLHFNYLPKVQQVLLAIIQKHYVLVQSDASLVERVATEGNFPFLLKMEDLFPPYRKLAAWENTLQELAFLTEPKASSASSTSTSESQSRIVYNVNKALDVFPRLQKSKDGGATWTKGRSVALATFKQGKTEGMTDLDFRVAACVKAMDNGYYYSNAYYILNGSEVLEVLAGYPYVYMDENPSIPIVITKEEPQLVVSKTNTGYHVSANVDDLEGAPFLLKKENDQLYRVVEVNATQKGIIEAFLKNPDFPAEAKDELAGLLGKLARSVTVHSDLIQNQENLERVKGDTLITVQLQPVGDGIKAELFVKPLVDCPPYCKAGEGAESVIGTVAGKRVQIMRNLKKEKQNLEVIQEILRRVSDDPSVEDTAFFDDYYQCLDLVDALREQTKTARTEWPEGAKLNIRSVAGFSNLKLSLKGVGYWFEVDGELHTSDGIRMKVAELLKKVRESKGRFIALGDSDFLALSDRLRKRLKELDNMLMDDRKPKIASSNAGLLTDLEQEGIALAKDKAFTDLQKRIEQSGNVRFDVPATLQAELRNYQVEGFQWMSRLAYWGAGACLADDMGLGKTVQAIALMLKRAKEGACLVVAPASVLLNWQSEIQRFAPSLNCKVMHSLGDREKMVKEAGEYDVVLTTYGVLISESELLASRMWNVILLDEAHTIKNKETKMSKAAMELKGDFRLLLTGTPIQNHLSEIWNLFQFANPGLLGSFSHFNEHFIVPIEKAGDKQRQKQLKNILHPFLLRRTKTEVLDELPQKTEIVIRVELSPEEEALYDNIRQQAVANIEEGSMTPMQTLAEITRLRQAACHPALVDSKLNLPSSKTQAFLKLVDELMSNHHRALVFSQFTSHLALIRKELEARNISYLYLDGSVSVPEREKLVRRFQTGEEPLFLISLKAGGTGLNLTAADYVIHLDPWWNPAIEDQASDRAYRIGQTRPVTIYRLIATNTIEEKIVQLHQTKKSLADSLLDGSNLSHKLTKDEMLQLLKGDFND